MGERCIRDGGGIVRNWKKARYKFCGKKKTTQQKETNNATNQLNICWIKNPKPPKPKQNTPPKKQQRVINQKREQTNLKTTTYKICHLQSKDNSSKPDQKPVKITDLCSGISDRHLVVNFKTRPKRKEISAANKLVCDASKHEWSLLRCCLGFQRTAGQTLVFYISHKHTFCVVRHTLFLHVSVDTF